jgi:hypothetical protein
MGWEGVTGDWKVRGGQLIPGKGPEWMGIGHQEQDIGLPIKWGFPFTFNARGYAQIIDYVLREYKDKIFCVQVKNKSCVDNIIMSLIPWKRPRGSKTLPATQDERNSDSPY